MSAAKRSPRAMPVETIITRYKSAQQKQQQQHQTQKQQHSGRHRIQKQQQHSVRHRIQKQQKMSERQRLKKQQDLSERHRAQKQQYSEQNSMHTEQQASGQHGTEKQQQLPEQHGIQKELQVTAEQLKVQKQHQAITEQQQQLLNRQYSSFITKGKSTSKPANVEKPKRVKSSKDFQKTARKITIDDHTEFYPEKLKRTIDYKRVVLRPQHRMKIIGGIKSCNKRKLHMPRKDVKRIRHNSDSSTLSTEPKSPEHKSSPELSIQEMVLLIEEGGGLDREGLLEILTCPSPVWWEDPPPGYIEEPLFARQKPAEQKSIKNQLLDEQNREAERRKQRELEAKDMDSLDVSKLGINIENRGDKFMNKRCKLESLLGTIRNKVKKIDEEVDLNINNNLNVKIHKLCDNISEDENLNKNQSIKVQDSNSNNVIEKNVSTPVFNSINTENVEKFNKNLQESNVNKIDKCIKISESNTANSENRHTKNDDTKCIINRKTEISSKSNMNNIKKSDGKNQNNSKNISNVQNISADSMNRIKRDSDSFEEDALLDLEDHELLNLENMNIPIAPSIETNSVISVSDLVTVKDMVYPDINDLEKMSKNICNSISGTKVIPRKAEKQTKCMEQKFSEEKGTSDEIVKSMDKLIKIDNSSNEIQKFSFIRVRKLKSLQRVSTEMSDIAGETSCYAIDDNKERSRDDSLISKNEGKYSNTSTIKIVRESNYNKYDLLSNNKSVITESSNSNIEVPCSFNTKIAKDKPNECGTKNFNKFHKRISPIIHPIADGNFKDSYSSECNKITGAAEINSSSFDKDTLNDNNLKNIDATLNKISENYDHDKKYNNEIHDSIKNKEETIVRRYSIDSTISDKNMSVEYLDLSLLDEDEKKMDIESHNYESDEQSQESSGICKNINFKSDLDMTDLNNMYDQISKSDNNDIIQYICDNQKETDHLKDKTDTGRIDIDFMKSENFRSSSPINQKIVPPSKLFQNLDNNETEYVSVYKIINSDSESDGNIMRTNDVKIPEVNTNNQINSTDSSEMKNTAFNENKTNNSETITYVEEYLTDFDEVTIIDTNELKEENVSKTNEGKDARNINSEGILMQLNEASARKEKLGDLLKLNEAKINEGQLTTNAVSEINDKVNKHNINNYYKHRKDIRKRNILQKICKNSPNNLEKSLCKLCSMKNKSIIISKDDIVKYCLACSSIYDTEDCRYCLEKLKRECLCEKSEYVCDNCSMKVSDKEMLIEHLKLCK